MSGSHNRQQGFEISYTTTEQCGTDEFVCLSDGQCQPPDARCNGETDCQDGSDEDGIMCGEHTICLIISIEPIQIPFFASTGCGNTYDTAPNGLLSSVSFPYPYPSEMECVYLISQAPGTYIQVEFLFFHIEGDGPSCDQSDFLEIRDGDSPNSPLFGRFCGDLTHAPTYVISRSNHLWMKWVTVRTLSLPY